MNSCLQYLDTMWRTGARVPVSPDACQPYLTFTDRSSYEKWTQEWKNTYAYLATTIRYQKALIKTVQQAGRVRDAADWMYQRSLNRRFAVLLLQLRTHGKTLASRQWALSHQK